MPDARDNGGQCAVRILGGVGSESGSLNPWEAVP